jgi:hypothetical protein
MSTDNSQKEIDTFHTPNKAGNLNVPPTASSADELDWQVALPPDKGLNMQKTHSAILEIREKVDSVTQKSSEIRCRMDSLCEKFETSMKEVCEQSRQLLLNALQGVQSQEREMVWLCKEDLLDHTEQLTYFRKRHNSI